MNLNSLKPIKVEAHSVPSLLRDDGCRMFSVQPMADARYSSAKRKVLILFQHVPSEDLRAGNLVSGAHGAALRNLLKLGREYAIKSGEKTVSSLGYAVANYAFFKTYHLESADKREVAERAERKRALALIDQLQPDVVLCIGNEAAVALTGADGSDGRKYAPRWRGHALPYIRDKRIKIVPVHDWTLSSRKSNDDDDDEEGDEFGEKKLVAEANLLGYASRCAATVFTHKFRKPYTVQEFECRYQLIDTIPKFDRFFAKLMTRDVVSVDSETKDLSRITNVIQTLQFAWSSKMGYILPIMHRDSPWKASQLEYIRQKLRIFFGRTFDPLSTNYNQYLIGQNFKFDMSPLREWLGIYAVYWPVWDIQAGEYTLDENIKQVAKTGYKVAQYNLGQIALNYGISWYENSAFGKDDRATIAARPLDDNVLSYCSVDVQAPFAIHKLQIARASGLRFNNGSYRDVYRRFIVTQMNNLVKIESFMEGRGVAVDAKWLRQLQLANGPLEKLKTELSANFRKSKAAQKANKRLMKAHGVPADTLWGNEQWMLKLSKPEHKQKLFIDVLGLEPLKVGKSGEPSIDKWFLKKYATIPEVAMFSELTGLEKLQNTYVSKIARYRKEDPDMRADGRVRPSFGFTDTVTGRSTSYDPNMQQIPTRGKHAKLIKRLFIASPGHLFLKMDYSAHEIRVWSIISGDKKLGQLFAQGRELRQKWRATEKKKYMDLLDTVGDIHKINCQLMFGTDPREVTKEQRDSVKALIFGSIYGMGPGTLASNLGKDKEFVLKLLDMFFSRYPKASAWLKWAKQQVIDNNFVTSPIGRRRNMFAHLYEGAGALEAAVKRMGSNSPIQGWAADMGHTASTIFLYHFQKVVEEQQLGSVVIDELGGINVMVHDSIEGDFRYRLWLVALQILQWCATLGCMQYYERHFGISYTVPLEVEFELGPDESSLTKWDWSETQLRSIIDTSLESQLKIYPDLDCKAAKKEILSVRNNVKLQRHLDRHYPILG